MRRGPDLVSIIEAAYAIEQPESAWLEGLATAVFEHSDLTTLGAYAQTYSLLPGGALSFGEIRFAGNERDDLLRLHDELGAYYQTRPDRILATYGETDEGYALALPGGEPARINAIMKRHGVKDMYGINARSPSGRGCLLCVYLPPRHRGIPSERRLAFSRIARHVAAGLRLRVRIGDGEEPSAEAVIDERGTIVQASGLATRKESREALRAAAMTIRRVRGQRRSVTPDRDVAAWKALVQARWSLVDHFESQGSYYLVAHRNDPDAAPITLLTERERQVVALASLGFANKLIAYELGIATSTVGVLLSRAMRRLGLRSRRALIGAYASAMSRRQARAAARK